MKRTGIQIKGYRVDRNGNLQKHKYRQSVSTRLREKNSKRVKVTRKLRGCERAGLPGVRFTPESGHHGSCPSASIASRLPVSTTDGVVNNLAVGLNSVGRLYRRSTIVSGRNPYAR